MYVAVTGIDLAVSRLTDTVSASHCSNSNKGGTLEETGQLYTVPKTTHNVALALETLVLKIKNSEPV